MTSSAADILSTSPVVLIPVADVIVAPDRQRAKAKADDALINSIRDYGLINPIIIRADNTLVAGERRLDAFRQLELPTIPARLWESLTPLAAFYIEMMENLARSDLTWQEKTKAIAEYHRLRLADFAGWTAKATATDLGYSEGAISQHIAVARQMDDADIAGAATFTGAVNLIQARATRAIAAAQARSLLAADTVQLIPANATREEKTSAILDGLTEAFEDAAMDTGDILDLAQRGEEAAALLRANSEIERSAENYTGGDERIICDSFVEWAPDYSGAKFDVIHCDFPYGKGYTGSNTRRTGRATTAPIYGDEVDIYFALVDALLAHQDRLLLPQAHCLFWFDMLHYCWTVEQFRNAGWRLVQPHPLIWTKSYQGVAADPRRRPRHCYETALLFSRGDRLIRKLDKDHFEEQVDEKLHISQKPTAMLRHFLQLVVDEHTAVLDPTCGSGSALAAAGQLGASRILGVEIDESNADIARFMLQRELS